MERPDTSSLEHSPTRPVRYLLDWAKWLEVRVAALETDVEREQTSVAEKHSQLSRAERDGSSVADKISGLESKVQGMEVDKSELVDAIRNAMSESFRQKVLTDRRQQFRVGQEDESGPTRCRDLLLNMLIKIEKEVVKWELKI